MPEEVTERAKEKATERITVTRGAYTILCIGSAGGVIAALSHGIELLHYLGLI